MPDPPTLQDVIRLARQLPEAERLRRLAAARQRLRAGQDVEVGRFVILLLAGCASGPRLADRR